MICTKCSEVIRPVVAFDIDGTLAEYHRFFGNNFARRYWGLLPLAADWNGYGEFEDFLGLDKTSYREAKLAYRQGGMKRVQPVMPWAEATMRMMRETDAEIWITTTRPWRSHDSIDQDTLWWLKVNDIPFDHILYDENKYEVLAERVGVERVAFVLDDLPEQFEIGSAIFGGAMHLITRPHNEWYRSTRTVYGVCPSLHSAGITAVRLMDQWEANNT